MSLELELLEEKVFQLSNECSILNDYITLKFGLDYQQFRKSYPIQQRSSNSSKPSPRTRSGNRSHTTTTTTTSSPSIKFTENDDQEFQNAPIKIEIDVDDDFPDAEEVENVMGVVIPETFADVDDDEEEHFVGPHQVEESDNSDPDYDPGPEDSRINGTTRNEQGNNQTKRKMIDWKVAEEFDNLEEAKSFISQERKWVYSNKYKTQQGHVILYLCRQTRSCSAKLRIALSPKSKKVRLERTIANHDHLERAKRGIEIDVQAEIIRLLENETIKPKAILASLQEKGMELPTKLQLSNFLARRRQACADSTAGSQSDNESEADSDLDKTSPNLKRSRMSHTWIPTGETFPNFQLASQKLYKNRILFDCKYSRGCSAKVHFRLADDSVNGTVSVFKKNKDHYDHIEPKRYGISVEVKDFVDRLLL